MQKSLRKKTKIRDLKTGKWLDTKVFRREALRFMETGSYCSAPIGTPDYIDYWEEQLRRTREGYEVDGVKITGNHYFYLNFAQIQLVVQTGRKSSRKVTNFPDFWDGDYEFFWCLEIAKDGLYSEEGLAPSTKEEKETFYKYQDAMDALIEKLGEENAVKDEKYLKLKEKRDHISRQVLERIKLRVIPDYDYLDGGHHFIVGKSRRKGYSYKNAAICANIYNNTRKSLTIIGAFDKKFLYPEGTMGMTSSYMSFLNKHTAWAKKRLIDKQEHKKSGFEEEIEGVKTESGYLSQVIALSFGDNPDAARGKDARIVLFEEAGAFPNLKDSVNATAPGLTAGKYITGQMIIFGTGGDMESGTVDFSEMFYHPKQYNLMPFVNIWDENATNSYCGFFHPVYWNMEGYYDENGNSDIEGAIREEKRIRKNLLKNSTSTALLQKRVQEYPLCPAEAFLTVSTNDFPTVELRNHLNKVIREELHLKKGQPVELYRCNETGKIKARVDLEGRLQPIWDYIPKTTTLDGSVVIFRYPEEKPIPGLYKIGFDPYRQAQSNGSSRPSLACIYVYKSTQKFSYSREEIVAMYIGRPYSPDTVNRTAEMLAELYNAEIMHENEVTHVKSYFERRKKLHLLAVQPDAVISKNVQNSKVARVYGIHMNDKLKDAGEKYIKQWLLEERDVDENGNVILNLETIYDPGLLEELILYNRKGNFDRVMAFMMVMFQLQEEELGKEYSYEYEESEASKDILNLIDRMKRKH